MPAPERAHRFLRGRRGNHGGAARLERRRHHLARVRFVVHQQHAEAVQGGIGLAMVDFGDDNGGRGRRSRGAARRRFQPDREGGAAIDAGALGADRSFLRLDEVAGDEQAEAETADRTRRRAVALAEPLEHVRQGRGVDADAGVHDRTSMLPPADTISIATRPPAGVNLTAFDSRLRKTCSRRRGSATARTSAGGSKQPRRPCPTRLASSPPTAPRMFSPRSTSWRSSTARPATIRDTSSSSSMRRPAGSRC